MYCRVMSAIGMSRMFEVLAPDHVEEQVERTLECLEEDLERLRRDVEVPRHLRDGLSFHDGEGHFALLRRQVAAGGRPAPRTRGRSLGSVTGTPGQRPRGLRPLSHARPARARSQPSLTMPRTSSGLLLVFARALADDRESSFSTDSMTRFLAVQATDACRAATRPAPRTASSRPSRSCASPRPGICPGRRDRCAGLAPDRSASPGVSSGRCQDLPAGPMVLP